MNTRRLSRQIFITPTNKVASINKIENKREIFSKECHEDEALIKKLNYMEEPHTPKQTEAVLLHTPPSATNKNAVNHVMARIQADLNSPSANTRVRALRALKSPNFKRANYEVFDIAREEQDLITEAEREIKEPPRIKSLKEVFKNVCVYVEVRTGDDNRTSGIKHVVSQMGCNVNEKLYKDTTHLIFKDGLLSTYNKAKRMNIPIVSLLWIDACKKNRRLVDPQRFPISNKHRYENPELYKKIRRPKSMQPELSDILLFTKGKSKTQSKQDDKKTEKEFTKIDKDIKNKSIENLEETLCNSMELTVIDNDKTLRTPHDIEITASDVSSDKMKQNARVTTFTPRPMEQTIQNENITPINQSILTNRRKTLFTPSILRTPSENIVEDMELTPNLRFNSTNRISKYARRSVLDVSMSIIENNLSIINSQTKSKSHDIIEEDIDEKKTEDKVEVNATKTAIRKKRKLFDNFDELNEDDFKENVDSPKTELNIKSSKIKKITKEIIGRKSLGPKVDKNNRRKTISFFKDVKPKEQTVRQPIASQKEIKKDFKYMVTTNLKTDQLEQVMMVSQKL